MARLLAGCGALVVLLAVAGCNNPTSTTTETHSTITPSTKTTEKQEGTAPAGTLKEPGHIPGG